MKTQPLRDGVLLISECPRPVSSAEVCDALAEAGVDSLLVVDEAVTPWPSRQGRLWCYVRPLANPASPLGPEVQRIADFIHYETWHGRSVGIWIGYDSAKGVVVDAASAELPRPADRPPTDDPCCCRPYHDGCDGSLLCHAAPVEAAQQILYSGRLLSSRALSAKLPQQPERREDDAGDPADYYDYVCFANGDCVAPDIVAMQRHARRWLRPEECDKVFYPGARLFFRPKDLFHHPRAAWDGIQAVKVREEIDLDQYLTAVVLPGVDRNGKPLEISAPPDLEGRVITLDHRQHYGLAAWSTAALQAAARLMSNLGSGDEHRDLKTT